MRNVEAAALAYALEMGAATVADSQQWADAKIQASDVSDEVLMLSTERSDAEAVSLLHLLADDADPPAVGPLVYRYLLRALEANAISPQRAAQAVFRVAMDGASPSRAAADEAMFFDDAYYLAEHGQYGTVAWVTSELYKYLGAHAA